jgi:prepilin-type N-terminal cleavage/methylation domain-containing protein
MIFSRRDCRGFTLIEIMIIVAVIGILAAVAIPLYMSFKDKAARGTAMANLAIIQQGLTMYVSENDNSRYPTTEKIGEGLAGWSKLREIIQSQNLPPSPESAKLRGDTFSYVSPDGRGFTLYIRALDSRSTQYIVTPTLVKQIW